MDIGQTGFRRTIRRVLKDRSGGVLIYTALLLPFLCGVAALSIDVSLWHLHKRFLQKAADAAAVAGVLEYLRTGDPDAVVATVEELAMLNGLNIALGDTITVNRPPASGPNQGSIDAVEVIVRRRAPILLSAFFTDGNGADIAARAVAAGEYDNSCVVVLNPTISAALKVAGSSSTYFDCGLIVNSSNAGAVSVDGGGCVTATKLKIVGGYTGSCITPTPETGVDPVPDPLREVPPPTYGVCDITSKLTINAAYYTFSPGPDGIFVVCADITIKSSANVTFEPGLYVLKGGIDIGAQSTVTGTDLHFYMPPTSKTVTVSAGAVVNLRAREYGPLAGLLFYQDRQTPAGLTHNLTGGGNMNLSGILYFPKAGVTFSGGSASGMSESMIIADTVNFQGGTNLGNLLASPIYDSNLLSNAHVVE